MKPVMIEPELARKAFVKHHFLNEDFIRGEIERAIQTQRIQRLTENILLFQLEGRPMVSLLK